ncbi:hypothetical protein ACVXZW_13065 [Lacticaseibacillus paracasei]|uniref:hypothetical protein n=1 Tax=Lacticaseibacillus paracasei TaxID=1597 RepID=UPI000F4F5C00|nr:hypothetical protein [Lacticaseibacillus paracasei]
MKTGDDTFDDIYVSKKTGKVVGVMLNGRDYKLVPFKNSKAKQPSRFEAGMRARGLFIAEENKHKVMELVDWIYGKEEEK